MRQPAASAVTVPAAQGETKPSEPPPAAKRQVCEITGRRDVRKLVLFTPQDTTRSAAIAWDTAAFELSWSGFRRGASKAHVRFLRPKVAEFDGLAELGLDWFDAARPFELVPGCISTWRGARVHPVETQGESLVVSVKTPFSAPERLEATVECAALSFTDLPDDKPKVPKTIDTMLGVTDTLSLHRAPGEPLALRATFADANVRHAIVERAPGWRRILEAGESSVALAWVPETELRKLPRFGRSHRARPPRVHGDRFPIELETHEITESSPLFAGDARSRVEIAKILQGARVRIIKRDGDWASIAFADYELVHGELGAFWVDARALSVDPVERH